MSEDGGDGGGSKGVVEGSVGPPERLLASFRGFRVGEWMERMEGMEERLRGRLLPLMLP